MGQPVLIGLLALLCFLLDVLDSSGHFIIHVFRASLDGSVELGKCTGE